MEVVGRDGSGAASDEGVLLREEGAVLKEEAVEVESVRRRLSDF